MHDSRRLTLSIHEITILMGAVNTYSGVPFVRSEKPRISEAESTHLQFLFDTFLQIRTGCYRPGQQDQTHSFAVAECRVMLTTLERCATEFSGDALDLRIHLSVNAESELNQLVAKLRQTLIDRVQVIVRPSDSATNRYPLRRTVLRYENPVDSVAENDWEAGE